MSVMRNTHDSKDDDCYIGSFDLDEPQANPKDSMVIDHHKHAPF